MLASPPTASCKVVLQGEGLAPFRRTDFEFFKKFRIKKEYFAKFYRIYI